ncbi:hypothetical protein HNO88_001925 [Novosphingobium chloroacetimidivorans]|uniref:Uncharacterized protein n=1 Tax=Novosphingobium chloroacetimidivorans TaxID=1428314 RepID=A0A7W7K9A0_9SPHN|nr:DUF6010 family protein [Novosphingobium chloroacetimidivorans]MBB4858599.1 hypothetical protein [Novosphingobium chloroacetimidivorans]
MPDSTIPSNAHRPRPLIHGGAALVGIVLSLATLPLHLVLDTRQSVDISAVVVAVIGAIYVGFALQRGSIKQIVVGSIVAACFAGVALAGLWWNPWIIPAGYVAHGLWDAVHHWRSHDLVEIPHWYPPFCAAFDWLYAIGLSIIWLTVAPV